MRKKNMQISLFDTYTDVCKTMEEDKSEFLTLLDEHIDFEAIVPPRFYHAYYSYTGRKRVFSLESFIRASLSVSSESMIFENLSVSAI